MDPIEVEKAQRIYYQSIVYWVCRELERAFGKRTSKGEGVICGTVYSPSNQVQQLMTELADSRVAWAEEQAAKQSPVTPYLSPTAAGPGLDAEGFVRKVMKAGSVIHNHDLCEVSVSDFVAELRAALGAGEDGQTASKWESDILAATRRIETHVAVAELMGSMTMDIRPPNTGPVIRDLRSVVDYLKSKLDRLPPDPAPNEGGVK